MPLPYFYKEFGLGLLTGKYACPKIEDIRQHPPMTKTWTKEKMIRVLNSETEKLQIDLGWTGK